MVWDRGWEPLRARPVLTSSALPPPGHPQMLVEQERVEQQTRRVQGRLGEGLVLVGAGVLVGGRVAATGQDGRAEL